MITRSDKKTSEAKLQRKIDRMPKKAGNYYKVCGLPKNIHIFVEAGKDPEEAVRKFKKKHGY